MAGHSEAHIAKRAYEIWEKEGRPHGRDREHWLKAVEELSASIVAEPVVLKPVKAPAPKGAVAKAVVPPTAVAATRAAAPAIKVREAVTSAPRTKSAPKKK
jgi:hypothetical protein